MGRCYTTYMDIEALLSVIIPLVLLQAVLLIVALTHILKHDTIQARKSYAMGVGN